MKTKADIDRDTGLIWESYWRDIELARKNKKVVHRARTRLSNSWPGSDCGHPLKDPCGDEATLRQRLATYADISPQLEINSIVQEVSLRSALVANLGREEDRILDGIHGKQFFKEVVVSALNGLIGQRDAAKWRVEIADNLGAQWPQYLVQFADELLRP